MSNVIIKERVKNATTRAILYEEDGETKIFAAPAVVSNAELLQRFERAKGARFDPASGRMLPHENPTAKEPRENDELNDRNASDPSA